jgi:hypothetical protein
MLIRVALSFLCALTAISAFQSYKNFLIRNKNSKQMSLIDSDRASATSITPWVSVLSINDNLNESMNDILKQISSIKDTKPNVDPSDFEVGLFFMSSIYEQNNYDPQIIADAISSKLPNLNSIIGM